MKEFILLGSKYYSAIGGHGSLFNTLKCMGTLSGEVTLLVAYIEFASLLKRDLLSRERICSYWSKFFSLRVNPGLEGLCQLGKQTGSHKSNSPQ